MLVEEEIKRYERQIRIFGEKGQGKLKIDLEQEFEEGELTLEVVEGEVTPGESITGHVTFQGEDVEGALVEVNDDEVGTTDGDGHISFTVPYDEELKIEAVLGELEGELEIDLEGE